LWRILEATPDIYGYRGPCEEREIALLKALFNHLGSVPASEEYNSFSQTRYLTVDVSLLRLPAPQYWPTDSSSIVPFRYYWKRNQWTNIEELEKYLLLMLI